MAECKSCGKELTFMQRMDGYCSECNASRILKSHRQSTEEVEAEAQLQIQSKEIEDAALAAILLTTETHSDLRVVRRIEIITAECAFGMNIFKDILAGVRDIVGGRSEAVQKTMRDARRTVLAELRREAKLVGANAVLGVDLDYVELGSMGTNMVLLVASGTAVVIDNERT